MTVREMARGDGLRVVVTSVVLVFAISAIFWAGSTYQRVVGIEGRLVEISATLSKFGDLQGIVDRITDNQKRVDRLEEKVVELEIKDSTILK